LGGEQRAELHGEALDEVLVGEDRRPVRAAVGVIVELPQMDELVDRAGVGLEVADQLLVLTALLQRRVPELGVQLDRLAHLADVQRVGPHLETVMSILPDGRAPALVVVRDERSAATRGGQGIWQNGATEEAMKGVVFLGDRKLELREFPDPTPGPRDVILEIKASGMCGSDLHNYRAPANPGGVVTGGIARQ